MNLRSSLRPSLALGLLAALALAGCGGSGSGASSSTEGSTTTVAPSTSTQATTAPNSGEATESSPEASIEGYGSLAQGVVKAEVAKAAFSFFRAMAASEYPALCAGLSAANREQLQAFLKAKHQKGGCPTFLKTLIAGAGVAEAAKAAAGTLTAVRVKADTAFVLFRPKGGVPSYFVLKREGGEWRAISLAPGTPLDPEAG